MRKIIRGISVCNPVDIERDYLIYTVDYAIEHNIDHMQFIGPIHNSVKGNIDGMTIYRKYSRFNSSKDIEFAEKTMKYVNEACDKAHKAGIKTYVWHHELEVPPDFIDVYPEVCNSYGDVEVTHPIIRDFLENKLQDFFSEYPLIDGIVLTLHETRIPLLKLKNQKLDKKDRVKYVTQILFDKCRELGKELIVRTFASIEEDYEMMLHAFEEISTDLLVMDKWTQFDWSLTAPHNQFFNKVKNNPLFIETDIFGEFFGKGRLPLMLKEHIKEKFHYCEGFMPAGYVSRIDRGVRHPFGEVNEVNINIMNACMNNDDVDDAIEAFFREKYPSASDEVMALMERTEHILKKIIYLKGYYFSELSAFPTLNHSKNHFYFEMMRDNYCIASKEWFVPKNWERGSIDSIIEEKESAAEEAAELFEKLEALKDKIAQSDYENLWMKFANLKYVAAIWLELTKCFINYTKYFETEDIKYKEVLIGTVEKLCALNSEGAALLGDKFYCMQLDRFDDADNCAKLVKEFAEEIIKTLEAEEKQVKELKLKGLVDFVVCGGATEAHKMQKEVNFSDTFLVEDKPCRIPGSRLGKEWSLINAHGWFSYLIKLVPNCENTIKVSAGSIGTSLDVKITVGNNEFEFYGKPTKNTEIIIKYVSKENENYVRIRFDRISSNTPCIYTIEVKR